MTQTDFTCPCGRHVDVTRLVGGRVHIWHVCNDWSGGILAHDEQHARELWTAEQQRAAA